MVSQKIHRRLCKGALLNVENQARLSQPLQHLSKVLLMHSVVRRCYRNVVNVAKGEGEASQHLVHHPLEGLARVPQPNGMHTN